MTEQRYDTKEEWEAAKHAEMLEAELKYPPELRYPPHLQWDLLGTNSQSKTERDRIHCEELRVKRARFRGWPAWLTYSEHDDPSFDNFRLWATYNVPSKGASRIISVAMELPNFLAEDGTINALGLAETLGLNPKTVEQHLKTIRAKVPEMTLTSLKNWPHWQSWA